MPARTIRIDLDHNATTRLDPRVAAEMHRALAEVQGNPSSVHEDGRRARDLVESARAEVARLVNGSSSGVVFTSGGTEADVLGVVGGARAARAAGRPARVVSSPLEHPAVGGALAALAAEGFEIVRVAVDAAGRIDADEVARALAPGAALASFALANHELGNVYDVATFAAAAHRAGAFVHVDAVQAAGKLPLDAGALGADLVAISAHKLHGPKGAGALWVRPGVALAPLFGGGHQEKGLRPGTENVPGVAGLGAAARLARVEGLADAARVTALRDRLEAGARAQGARVHGDGAARVSNTLNLAWDGVSGEVLVIALDLEGISASMGAACTSGSIEPSPVLLALGMGRARAAEGIRLSLGRDNRDEDVDRVLAVLPALVARIRAAGPV